MKGISIKLKITLWVTMSMVALVAVVLVLIALISGSESQDISRGELIALVEGNSDEVELDDGEIEVDDDFVSYRNGMYCLVLSDEGGILAGHAPYDQLAAAPYEDGAVRLLPVGDETYLVYDKYLTFRRGGGAWVRGVSAQYDTVDTQAVYHAAMIVLPLMILLAAAGGYVIARRSLAPINKISATAREIGEKGDLSRRIPIGKGRDELSGLAQTFNEMFQRLEENFEVQRSFTSDASHELRTPVATILAQCEYAFEDASGEEELYEALEVVQRQGYRMSHLIESLLQFTRMEQRAEAFAPEIIDLSALTQTVCAEQTVDEGMSLYTDIQPGLYARADSLLMTRLMENLIRNALVYGKSGGGVWVSLRREGESLLLSVADKGPGIDPKELPKIWERFYRVDKSRSTGGLGLGLSMVKEIAKLHGGEVSAESRPGEGSRFTVKLAAAASLPKITYAAASLPKITDNR